MTRERGEVTLNLAGEDYVLRPTYEACSKIEEQTGLSLMQCAIQADDQTMSLATASVAATEFIRAYGKEIQQKSIIGVQKNRIGQLIFDEGVMKVLPRLAIALAGAVTGGVTREEIDEEGEGDDAGEKEPVTASPPAAG